MTTKFSDWFSRITIQLKLDLILENLHLLEARIMSALSDYVIRVEAKLATINTGIDGIALDIATLKAKIEELQNSPGAISPADQALLDEMESLVGGLSDRVTALDAETPAPPTP